MSACTLAPTGLGIPKGVFPFCGDTLESYLEDLVDVVCRVAIVAFSLYFHAIPTAIGLAIGVIYGLYVGHQEGNGNHCNCSGTAGVCASGSLWNISFPKSFNTLAAFGLTLEHVLHGCGTHEHYLLPFNITSALAGVYGGAWVGRGLWHVGRVIINCG